MRSVLDRFHELIAERCPPQRVSFPDLLDAVVRHLEAHEPERERSATSLIIASIAEQYGCSPLGRD